MTATVQTLTEQAQAVLDVAADALAYTTDGTPALVFQSPAPPADDCCPSLSVYVSRLSEENTSPGGIAAGRRTTYGRVNLATYVIRVMRCAPAVSNQGRVETADVEAVAAQVNEDAWVLWNAFKWAVEDETFKDRCSIVHWDASRYIGEMGGCVGWEFTISAEIDGLQNPVP